MKKVFILLFVFISFMCKGQNTHLNPVNQGGATSQGATYYVSPTGLSTGSGSTPATAITFARLITFSSSFVGGENIYLQAGGNYYGRLVTQSGSTIDMYNAGGRPIIRGTILASSVTWTQLGNIWVATMASRINRIFRNNAPERMAQSAYYTVTSKPNTTTIVASGAAGLGSWAAGTEIICKANNYSFIYDTTTAYNSGTGQFTIATGNGIAVNYQFKLLNDTNLIAADGDWAWKGGNIFYRSPGNVNPNTLNVELSFYDEGIFLPKNTTNVTINNISFFGQNADGIYGDSVNNISVNNCRFKNQFGTAIALSNKTHGASVINCQMDSIAANGILFGSTSYSNFSRLIISNIGVGTEPPIIRDRNRYKVTNTGFPAAQNYVTGFGLNLAPNSNNNIIQWDTVYNTSYTGLRADGSNNEIAYNVVHNFCKRQTDGGAIYSYSNPLVYRSIYGWDSIVNLNIHNNWVYNGVGVNEGGPSIQNETIGIYMDAGNYGADIGGNTVQDCTYGVLSNFNSKNIRIIGNNLYGNTNQIRIANWTSLNGFTSSGVIAEHNTLNSFTATQTAIYVIDFDGSTPNPFLSGGSCKNNTIISPFTNNVVKTTLTNYTLAAAQTFYGVTIGQQDIYTATFVDTPTAKVNVPLFVNQTAHSQSINAPLNFHSPVGKNLDYVLGPLMSTVYITGPPYVRYDSGSLQIGDAIKSRTVDINATSPSTPLIGLQVSKVEKALIGLSSAPNGIITGSIINDLAIRTSGSANSILFSGDGGNHIGFSIDSVGPRATFTLPATPATANGGYGLFYTITGAGNSSTSSILQRNSFLPGYTGSGLTSAMYANNGQAGTANTFDNSLNGYRPLGNHGGNFYMKATTTGNNMGAVGTAGGGNKNFGLWGASTDAKNAATNVGVFGAALNTGTTPIEVGGWFTLYSNTNLQTLPSTSLGCDNGSEAQPIFLARDNGTTVFSIIDGGFVGAGATATSAAQLTLAAATTSKAPINIPAGTAPTSPNHGDTWTDANHIYSRLNGVTYQLDQQSGGTTIYSGDGTLAGNRAVSGGSNSLQLGTSGSKVSSLAINSNAGIQLNGQTQYGIQQPGDANVTISNNVTLLELPIISANRTVTLPTMVTGSLIHIFNTNTNAATSWSFTNTVWDASGSFVISTLRNGRSYDVLYDGSIFILKDPSLGIREQNLFSQTADQTVTNTTTETTMIGTGVGSLTLPAGFLSVGKTLRIKVAGVFSTAAVTPGNVTINVKIGATTVATGTITNILANASSNRFDGNAVITCRTAGSSGTVVIDGSLVYDGTGGGSLLPANKLDLTNSGSTTIVNTTISNALDVTITWATASASNIAKSTVAIVESIN